MLGSHLLIALLYVAFETGVDFDNTPLACLLLKDDEGFGGKEVAPFQTQYVADTKPEKYPAADQERNGEVPVLIKPVHKGNRLVPFQGFSGRISAYFAHKSYDF